VGCLLTTGYATPFQQLTIPQREQILKNWSTSNLSALRDAYKSLSFFVQNLWVKTSQEMARATSYPIVPNPEHVKTAEGFPFVFKQFNTAPASAEPVTIQTDVIIIGSGCGGAVCAKNLAEAGHKVLVVEKAYNHPPSSFPMTELESSLHMYENGQIMPSDDGSIAIAAGATWGGGGSVNWSASLQTQGFVRKEWADKGLKFFESAEFQASLDRVCTRMGVSTAHIEHNHGNRVLLEGARKLGYRAAAVPQNTGGHRHYDGFCSHGCAAAEKMGPVNTWLPDAAKSGNAEFIEGFHVDKITFRKGTKIATGVKGTWTSRDSNGGLHGPGRIKRSVVIRAKKVILAAGTVWSPIVLLKSGVKVRTSHATKHCNPYSSELMRYQNYNIGRNFYAHPVTFCMGFFKEEVRPWEGGILTSVCTEFDNLDGHGHGVKIEATTMTPALSVAFLPWTGGAEYKSKMLKYKHMNSYISLARDRDPGMIYPDPVSGNPRVQYSPSAFDRKHILEGQLAIAKMLYVEGAEEIHVTTTGIPPFKRKDATGKTTAAGLGDNDYEKGINEESFQAWLALVRKTGLQAPDTTFANAHQMGTCRMGTSAKTSVVDPKGKVWGTENLYVSDASIFPSASGVNPMITNMGLSDWLSQNISKELIRERVSEGALGERAQL
jgi:choline dehydrogenase-like flavoprotein